MKKLIFTILSLAFVFAASARSHEEMIRVDDGIFLSGNQWHYDGFSILEANYNYYMVVSPQEYYYEKLPDFNPDSFYSSVNDTILSYQPYVYKGRLGWRIRGAVLFYFYDSDGKTTTLYPIPVSYKFDYFVKNKEYLDFSHWHWYRPYSNPFKHQPKRRAGCKTQVPKHAQLMLYYDPQDGRIKYKKPSMYPSMWKKRH